MRMMTAASLAARLRAVGGAPPHVVVAGNLATPRALLALVDDQLPAYELFSLNAHPPMPNRPGVVHVTPFVGPAVRSSPNLRYLPARLSLVPRLFAGSWPPDLVLLHTTAPVHGSVSLGIEVNILPAAVEAARRRGALVVAQVNPRMPWTCGDAVLAADLVDVGLEVDEPLASPVPRPSSDDAGQIGEQVAGLVPHGAVLQIGIGAVPDATLAALRGHRGLGVWSETFSDGVLDLERTGALDPDRPLVASFLLGSAELYAWVDRHPRVLMQRTETTNDPGRIARQPRMTSINAALQVDLFAQANAMWIGGRVHSGFGGQSDFTVGALHAPGGQAILALPSWHGKLARSTVVARLDGPVTSFQHTWIVSEQGRAAVWPRTQQEQTRALLDEVAHPLARDELTAAAGALGLLGRPSAPARPT